MDRPNSNKILCKISMLTIEVADVLLHGIHIFLKHLWGAEYLIYYAESHWMISSDLMYIYYLSWKWYKSPYSVF